MADPFESIYPFHPPQHLFTVQMVKQVRPNSGATIRVRVKRSDDWHTRDRDLPKDFFRHVPLYEFHPDDDTRLKFRGIAYIEAQRDLLADGNFRMVGEGYLDEPYMEVRETAIHQDDVAAITRWCRCYNNGAPLVIRACPTPFPMFAKGDRVRVVSLSAPQGTLTEAKVVGQLATCTEASSAGAMSTIRFDDETLCHRCGFNEIGFRSIDLRLVEAAKPAKRGKRHAV